ncbi:hypothetical protein BZG36_01852 [Bifiguratus adelaidae]|uniref:PQ-loop-domain-containing protein n=1 Tax=Bifiguratus adelaidae TaxID=1938954 RepID=A0A261Y2E1_9FUNG|nr:hypothetical protein BZG36_01852 [Bifiguratus adelaidae]
MWDHVFWSNVFGYVSICCWLVVFTPQLWENYKRKSGEGLSLAFLVVWLAGDIFNFVGAWMEDLLVTMLLLAVYYALADIGLIWQVYYYREHPQSKHEETAPLIHKSHAHPSTSYASVVQHKASDSEDEEEEEDRPRRRSVDRTWIIIAITLVIALLGCATWLWGARRYPDATVPSDENDEILGLFLKGKEGKNGPLPGREGQRKLHFWPQVSGWLSAVLYVGSRIPQVVKNAKAQSTEGLSPVMFFFCVMGNLTYCLSIFVRSMERDFLLLNLSWLVGSGGTLLFDFVICAQFLYYRHSEPPYPTTPRSLESAAISQPTAPSNIQQSRDVSETTLSEFPPLLSSFSSTGSKKA